MSFAKAMRKFDTFDPVLDKAKSIVPHEFIPVGSRVTFKGPHSPDSDWDYLVLVPPQTVHQYILKLLNDEQWVKCGLYDNVNGFFYSVRRNHLNLILTECQKFYDSFLLASDICKHLNIAEKENRIFVFEKIRQAFGVSTSSQ